MLYAGNSLPAIQAARRRNATSKCHWADAAIANALANADPDNAAKRRDVSIATMKRGMLCLNQQRGAEALTDLQAVLALPSTELEKNPSPRNTYDVAVALNGVGMALAFLNRPDEARALRRESLTLLEAQIPTPPTDKSIIDWLRSAIQPKPAP